jgi:hypothetical protein
MLGIIGGLLDFASASLVLIDGSGGSTMMTGYVLTGDAWAGVLALLGALVVAASLLSVTSTGVRHLKGFTLLMVLLGAVMAVVGTLMSGGPLTGSSLLYSYGMVIVGLLMAINGVMMMRNPMSV